MLEQIKAQIDRLKAKGATYVDTRWYPYEEANNLLLWNGNLKNASSSRESGVGIRVLYKGAWGFSALFTRGIPTGLRSSSPRTSPWGLGSTSGPARKWMSPSAPPSARTASRASPPPA